MNRDSAQKHLFLLTMALLFVCGFAGKSSQLCAAPPLASIFMSSGYMRENMGNLLNEGELSLSEAASTARESLVSAHKYRRYAQIREFFMGKGSWKVYGVIAALFVGVIGFFVRKTMKELAVLKEEVAGLKKKSEESSTGG